jgi:hypothetical protein
VAGNHVDFVALDLAGEDDLGLALDDPLPRLRGHSLGVVGVQVQLLSDLLVGEVQSHEIEAGDPSPQRLVMAGEDRPGQVIEAAMATAALATTPLRLGRVPALLDDVAGVAVGTADAVGPAGGPDDLIALGVVDDRLDVDHHR